MGDPQTLRAAVETAVRQAGLDAVGVTSTEAFPEVRRALVQRTHTGFHAGMSFTFRNPRRSTEPARLLRRATSMVVGAVGYLEPTPPRPDGPTGRVARYAWRDHYRRLRDALEAGAVVLRAEGYRAMVIADQNGLVDRAAAHRAGIGWWGRNANVLVPGHGSWFVLGALITDADLGPVDAPIEDGCRTCTRCLTSCPTDAIVADGVIDARRCLAWIVQQRGVMPRAYRVALGDRIYGCDDCQDVCPPGRNDRRVVAASTPPDVKVATEADAWVGLADILRSTDEELLARFGRWYVPDRKPRYLRRNALVVLGNVGTGDEADRALVAAAVTDADPLIRTHAVWAAARLGFDDLVALAAADDDPAVRAEVALAPTVPPAGRSGAPGTTAGSVPVEVRV